MPRLLRCEGVLRFDSSVGGGRATTFSARWKVRGSRDSSNPAPIARNLGLAGTRSQRPPCLSGEIAVLESAANGIDSRANLPGLAAAAPSIGFGFRAARQSYPREVRAERPHSCCACLH